jgi:hypothetical protein
MCGAWAAHVRLRREGFDVVVARRAGERASD